MALTDKKIWQQLRAHAVKTGNLHLSDLLAVDKQLVQRGRRGCSVVDPVELRGEEPRPQLIVAVEAGVTVDAIGLNTIVIGREG